LGREIVKLSPDEIPDIFFESDSSLTAKDIKFIKEYYTHNLYRESVEFQGEVGATIFDILINNKNNINILKIDKIVTKKKKTNIYITIADKFIEFFARKIYSPSKLPMVVTPAKWIDAKKNEGGFLDLNYKKRVNSYLIHNSFKNSGKSEIGVIQIDTVNFLNKQQFKINNDMLNLLIKEYFLTSSILYNGLNKQHPETIDRKLNSNVKKVLSHNSKFVLYNQVISIAILFKNISFYIPTFLDFRGRIYTEVDYFSYQAEDMAKSLIEFKNGCILDKNNIIYVLQGLANLGGKSKLTIKNKVK
jgi:DNA-directed RNA polymerase